MKLSECKMGAIVKKTSEFDEYKKEEIGHIVGLTRVFYTGSNYRETYYVAPIVKFADKEPYAVHCDNIEILED
jgi:hypothetical protein